MQYAWFAFLFPIAGRRSVSSHSFGDLAAFAEDRHLDGTPPTLAPWHRAMLETPVSPGVSLRGTATPHRPCPGGQVDRAVRRNRQSRADALPQHGPPVLAQ